LFAVEVAMLTASARGTFLPEIGFACAVAVQDVSLSAFFVVEHERDSDSSAIWPLSVVSFFSETYFGE
jgi:hypothetical protein